MKSDLIHVVANGEKRALSAPCSVADLVVASGLKPTQVVVELNGAVVSRNKAKETFLKQGDNIEIIMPVAGG
jgi:sulfur carrier protein